MNSKERPRKTARAQDRRRTMICLQVRLRQASAHYLDMLSGHPIPAPIQPSKISPPTVLSTTKPDLNRAVCAASPLQRAGLPPASAPKTDQQKGFPRRPATI